MSTKNARRSCIDACRVENLSYSELTKQELRKRRVVDPISPFHCGNTSSALWALRKWRNWVIKSYSESSENRAFVGVYEANHSSSRRWRHWLSLRVWIECFVWCFHGEGRARLWNKSRVWSFHECFRQPAAGGAQLALRNTQTCDVISHDNTNHFRLFSAEFMS